MEDWNSIFSSWNEGYFTCKAGHFRFKNKADTNKILVEIRDRIRRNVGLKFNF